MKGRQISLIQAGQLWTPDGFVAKQTIQIEWGKISSVDATATPPIFTGEVIEAADGLVIPGLIDLQVNGALGWSFQAAHQDHFEDILAFHLAAGTTTLLPTLITADLETLLTSLRSLAEFIDTSTGISLPGIHLEGPFLAPEKSGAHNPQALCLPNLYLTNHLLQAAQGYLKLVTLAPELPGVIAVIETLARQGIKVSAGHSAAAYTDMRTAMQAGLTMVTHAGNASDWPHRTPGPLGFMTSEPGVVGAFLAESKLSGGIIMDGFHFHPALLAPLVRLKGVDYIFLVSDASTVAGCPPGDYNSGGLQVTIHPGGFATSGRGGGWLAGSTITLLEAVQRAVRQADISLVEAIYLATRSPARQLGLVNKGLINPGYEADLLILNQDLSLRAVILSGQCVVEN